MAIPKVPQRLPPSDSLSAEFKSIIISKTYTKWNGKVFSRHPRILLKMMESIKAAWDAKSFNPNTVKKQILLNQVASTVNIIKTMKDRLPLNPSLDVKEAKSLINETQGKIIQMVKGLSLISDPKIDRWIDEQKAILEMFSEDLTYLQIALPVINEGEQKSFHINLRNFPTVQYTENQLDDIQHFQRDFLKAALKPPKEEIRIHDKTLMEVLPHIPDPRLRLLEVHHEKDPVIKLQMLASVLGKDLLDDGFGIPQEQIAADDFLPIMESVFRQFPKESLLIISDIMTVDTDELSKMIRSRVDSEKDDAKGKAILMAEYIHTTLFSIVHLLLHKEP